VTDLLPTLMTIGIVLGTWTLVSLVGALLVIPWFRARARANAALTQLDRSADWASAAQPGDGRRIAER
jgi:hypothetical protein